MEDFTEYWKTLKPMAQQIIGLCILCMVVTWTILIRMMRHVDKQREYE